MATAAKPTEESQPDKPACPECGIYMGCHRPRCSRLDRTDDTALRNAYNVEEYFRVRMK